MSRWRRLLSEPEAGNAIVEFVFVAVLVIVPLVYLILAVATVQASNLGDTQAAREAGRAFATADTPQQGLRRVDVAVRLMCLALADQQLPDDADVRFVATGDPCDGPATAPVLTPGSDLVVCVTRHAQLPAVPTVLTGRGITTVGRFVVHVDDDRSAP